MTYPYIVCQGSGNRFVLLDQRGGDLAGIAEAARARLAQELCRPTTGFGVDGLLLVQDSPPYDGKMVIYNADGSRAKMCGNGLRCVARFLSEAYGKEQLMINTDGGPYPAEVVPDFAPGQTGYAITIDTIDFKAISILHSPPAKELLNQPIPRLKEKLPFSTANVPNPHLVAQLEEPDTTLLTRIGERCNTEPLICPAGTNVNFFTLLDQHTLFVETYERGVGLTNACGTGMVASSLIAHRLGLVPAGEWITVRNKGGMVKTRIHQTATGYAADLLGDAVFMENGQLSDN